jgi:hypothetical protein
MKGKYMKDIAPQSDPFGGVFEGASETQPPETEGQSQGGAPAPVAIDVGED